MAKTIIDLSGRVGLIERHQGDLNDTTPSPNLRYLGAEGSFADGIWNPFSYYGYTSPGVGTYTTVTGTIAAPIVSFAYDNLNDILYAAEKGENILQLAGTADTSLASFISIASGDVIKDMILYEMNNTPAILYVIDSGDDFVENTTTGDADQLIEGGMYVGFKTFDTTKGISEKEVSITSTIGSATDKIDRSGGSYARLLAQSFTPESDISGIQANAISGVELKLRRSGGTGSGVTMKVSLQAGEAHDASPYTDRGVWATSTGYVALDTVNVSTKWYVCHTGHTSAAADQPGVGANYEDYWDEFGAPNGTALASGTFTLSDIPANSGLSGITAGSDVDWNAIPRTVVEFDSVVTMDADAVYWIVIEEVGTNMSASDQLQWAATANGAYSTYNTDVTSWGSQDGDTHPAIGKYFISSDPWRKLSTFQSDIDGFDFKIVLNRDDNWSSTSANGAFGVEPNQDSFLYLSENGLVYWVVGNQVHSLDGSATGGEIGTVSQGILLFPSYITVTDIAETRGRQYLGVQTSVRTDATDSTDDSEFFSANRSGIYVWDRRSQVTNGSDFFPTPGAKEVRNVFTTSTGDIAAITVNNSGFCELRQLSGNQFAPIHTLEKLAYPTERRGISQAGNFTIWLGTNGIWYAFGQVAPGEPLGIYKIGTAAGLTAFDYPGAIFVGNDDSSNNEMGVYFGWTDTNPAYKVSKWYPNGEGTIDSNAQQALQGDVYTKVYQLPSLSTVRYIRGFHMPGSTDSSTIAATLKCYINQSTTAAWSKSITYADLARGWFEKEWNQPNINFIQFEIEWITNITIGADTYRPMYLEVETGDEGRINT